jgi:hypothetical protein
MNDEELRSEIQEKVKKKRISRRHQNENTLRNRAYLPSNISPKLFYIREEIMNKNIIDFAKKFLKIAVSEEDIE